VFVAVPVARGALLPKKGMLASKATAAHRGGTDVWFRATVPASAEGSCCLMLGDRVLEVAPFSAFSTDILLVTSKDALHGADGSLRLSVVDDATGRPYAGAHVRVQIAGGPKLSAVADADGSVILEHVLEGEAQVRITSFDPDRVDKPRAYVDDAPGVGEAPRVGEARRAVIVHAGRETDLGRIALARTVKISGHIERTPDGKRATGVMLSISPLRLEPDGSISPISELAVVQPDGSFEFVGANPGTYFVSATFPPSNTREPIEVASSTVDARFGDVSGAILVVNPAAALVPSVSPSAFDYLRSHDR
jgi:hypothetical protein